MQSIHMVIDGCVDKIGYGVAFTTKDVLDRWPKTYKYKPKPASIGMYLRRYCTIIRKKGTNNTIWMVL